MIRGGLSEEVKAQLVTGRNWHVLRQEEQPERDGLGGARKRKKRAAMGEGR